MKMCNISLFGIKNNINMKKQLLILLILCTMTNLAGFSQVTFGVKGGLNMTDINSSTIHNYEKNNNGFFFGPTAKIALPLGFGIDGSLLYDQRSAKVKTELDGGKNYSTTVKQQQITVPVNLRYGADLSKQFGVYLFVGPQFGFNVGDKTVSTNYDDWDFKTAQLSVNIGAGATIFNHLQVSANYNLACSKAADLTINDNRKIGNGKMNAWQISLGYFF